MFINEVPNGAELSAIIINELRDMYGVKYRKDKKMKDHSMVAHRKIFGLPLHKLDFVDVKLSNGSLTRVPNFVSDACSRVMEHIDVEGLFRKAGSSSRQKEIREKLESGIPVDDSCNVIDVANILKYFFRELPEPLLPPGNFQETILRCLVCKGTQERKISAVKMVCLLLPVTSLNTLIYFMQFLHKVSTHSATNKMTARNLAIIFAPGLMPINENCGQRLNSHVQIIEILIQHAHELGVIGSNILNRMPNVTLADGATDELSNFTMVSEHSQIKVPDTDMKKKKKRRSGSLTRVFNGIRKIVGAIGSSENLDETFECEMTERTPCIAKSKKRKVLEASAFSSKKKKDVMSLLPNGGVLPSTPMHNTDKPVKKTRLSLGTKRFTKNGADKQSNGSKSSIVSSLERRWSFMVTGSGSRHNQSQKEALNTIQDVTFTSPAQDASVTSIKHENWEPHISKSEYEAIKERVCAIETRISKEFTKLQSSLSNNSLDSIDMLDNRNGPERVLEKFERTKEETEMMNTSPMTEQLAKHLSRGLKIRSSAEAKVCRSPSARKIGSIRRRSQENVVRLQRTKSWHLGTTPLPASPHTMRPQTRVTRNSPLQPIANVNSPTVDRNMQIPRVNLKRGKPNTFQNGLRLVQKHDAIEHVTNETKPMIVPDAVNEAIRKNDFNADLQNENWVCADIFFEGCATPKDIDDTPLNTSKNNSARSSASRTKPVRKRLYVDNTPTQTQPANPFAGEPGKTPMLPPRLPMVKKTPAKTPHQQLSMCRNLFTPLLQQEQQIAGRASIARLRNQNAGMVMAKAKLFDNLVHDEPTTRRIKPVAKITDSDSMNRTRGNLNVSRSTDSPRRNAKLSNVSGVQRRQQLRQQRTPIKKTPGAVDKTLLTLTEPSHRLGRMARSPALDVSTRSPITRRMAALDATPHSQRHMVTKPPRRLVRTPQKVRPN